jgi:peptidoglycan/xylan/chitin deacetylase (PgdA/CDA1 family)
MPSEFGGPRNPWIWPGENRMAFSVGCAFEAFEKRSQYGIYGDSSKTDHFSVSYGDYGWKAGAWRLFELMREYGIKMSMSVNGLAAERHPEVVREAMKDGYEIVGHGWANDVLKMRDDDPDAEREEIRRSTEALLKAGAERPVGWTSPGSTGSKNTLSFLRAAGYIWNGDDASDDLPFVVPTQNGSMVMMPRANLAQSDIVVWLNPRNPPNVVWEGFKDTFDTLYAEAQSGQTRWMELGLHCHIGGRPTLVPTIRKCLDYVKQHTGVWYARKRDIAEWALEHDTPAKAGAA